VGASHKTPGVKYIKKLRPARSFPKWVYCLREAFLWSVSWKGIKTSAEPQSGLIGGERVFVALFIRQQA